MYLSAGEMALSYFRGWQTRRPCPKLAAVGCLRWSSTGSTGLPWTVAEDATLRTMRENRKSFREIMKELPTRSEAGCSARWNRVLAPRDDKGQTVEYRVDSKYWTPEEDRILTTMRQQGGSFDKIAEHLPRRSVFSVINHWFRGIHPRLGLWSSGKRYARFSKDDESFILNKRGEGASIEEIARSLRRTEESIRTKYAKLTKGMPKPDQTYRISHWSAIDDSRLRKLVAEGKTIEKIHSEFPNQTLDVLNARLVGLRHQYDRSGRIDHSTREQVLDLRAKHISWREISERLGRPETTLKSIRQRAIESNPDYKGRGRYLSRTDSIDRKQTLVNMRAQGRSWNDIFMRFPDTKQQTLRNLHYRAIRDGMKPAVSTPIEKITG